MGRGGEGLGIEPAGEGAFGGGELRVAQAVGTLDTESGEGVQIGLLGNGEGRSGLAAGDGGELPAAKEAREFPDEAGREVVGNVASGDIFFEAAIEGVSGLEGGGGSSEDGGVEDGAGVIDQAREGVGEGSGEGAGEAFLEAGLEGVVSGVADVVAIERDVIEARKGAKELLAGDVGAYEGELFDSELIQVDVGDTEVGEFRAEVAEFEDPVAGDGFLEREVPLLSVAALLIALDGEDGLAEAGIGVGGGGRDGGSLREEEGGTEVVERGLLEGADEGEEGRGEGRGDAGLFDPGETVAGAKEESGGELEGEADAWGEVRVFEVASGARESVLAEEVELLGAEIEDGAAIVADGGGEVEGVANAEVEGESRGEADVVLEEEFGDAGTGLERFFLEVDLELLDLPKEEGGDGVSGEDGRELEVAQGGGGLEDVEGLEADIGSGFEAMGSGEPGVVIEELGDGGGEVGAGTGRRSELLEAGQVVDGEIERAAAESAAGVAEAELIGLGGGAGEGVFGDERIGASEGVAEDAGGEVAGAIGKRRDGLREIAEEGVAGKEAMGGAEVVVEAGVELILSGAFVAGAAVVVGGGG